VPLILQMPPWSLRAFYQTMRLVDGRVPGTHGYEPEHPDMAAAMFALGRGVPAAQRIERAHMVDVAPTVAALLGIEPPADSIGHALFGHEAAGAASR
jgi:predicted AlkP superfamily pyrophosphatase or phosphodiesterase